MESVYKIYCASYEHALLLVESYRKDPSLQEEILETLNATVYVPAAEATTFLSLLYLLALPFSSLDKLPVQVHAARLSVMSWPSPS